MTTGDRAERAPLTDVSVYMGATLRMVECLSPVSCVVCSSCLSFFVSIYRICVGGLWSAIAAAVLVVVVVRVWLLRRDHLTI